MTPKRMALGCVALLVGGILLAAIATSTALDAAGVALGGIAVVGLVSTGFYAIGLSEDRERARDDQRRGAGDS
jgi:hypothetical protein